MSDEKLSDQQAMRYIRESLPLTVGTKLITTRDVRGTPHHIFIGDWLNPKGTLSGIAFVVEVSKQFTRAELFDKVEHFLNLQSDMDKKGITVQPPDEPLV